MWTCDRPPAAARQLVRPHRGVDLPTSPDISPHLPEASIEVSYYECLAEDDAVTHGYPIGFQGDAGVPVYVLDPSDPATPLAAGQRGEICIGGIQVAR